ncbi:abortive infection system antitoxin AbiGi family protein [Pseudomonas sp. B5(2017)]|uniref:abortive infection system antitoxin AbiGi family protein n=1 Tax=Pseudomonas sp. B5(2017) TaxID=1981714 RepID=UPI0015942219|nr:abortive infection system antitoxin AbiGi family protein [Pseudomonas sp. B5(2017)]
MPLSSNSLIHLTNSKDALFGILSEGFRVKYCKEKIKFGKGQISIHVPMVSFCDIPLSQIKDHIGSYGSYGIGLSKEWAVKNLLNPVLYVQQKSNLATSYENVARHYLADKVETDEAIRAFDHLMDVARYMKNYEGPLVRKSGSHKSYRFSDEREWRYVPEISYPCEIFYRHDEFDEEARIKAAKSLSDLRLGFEASDIKYVIIDSEDEIDEVVEHLERICGKKYSYSDLKKLTTRILTAQQIRTDI